MPEDHFADAIGVAEDVIIPEVQDLEAAASKPRIPDSIHGRPGVLPAIDLNDQICLDTGKVSDVRANRQLATKSLPA